jgi:hypothetical protein
VIKGVDVLNVDIDANIDVDGAGMFIDGVIKR